MYVDYEFYSQTYGGKVPEILFNKLATQASAIIDYYTFNRIKEADNNVKYATCELIDYIKNIEDKGGQEVASEKVGTHSMTYVAGNKDGIDPIKKKQRDIVKKWLGHTGLMYRGVYP